jgi:hypothetical protein
MSGAKVDEAFNSLIKSIYEKAVLQHVYKQGPTVCPDPASKKPVDLNGKTKGKKDCCQ